jgi:hypothetical protein
MNLSAALTQANKNISDIDYSKVLPANVCDPFEVRGRIAERLALERLILADSELDVNFPRKVNGFEFQLTPHGIIVVEERQTKHEYDFLVFYKGKPHIIEVKSLRLNGFETNIPRALQIASELYQQEVPMIIIFPMYCNKIADAKRIQRNFPQVTCVDAGYKKKQLEKSVDYFYRSRLR